MAVDYNKFNAALDQDELAEAVKNAKENEYQDLPQGNYTVEVEKMELKETKAGDKLMFSLSMRVKEGVYKKRLMFFNRVICGNKSPKWTDAQAIKSVITFVNKFGCEPITFANYADFADQILDVYQEIKGNIEVEVEYDPDAFNPISFTEDDVYEIA